jgi:hypothetical protein
MVFAELVVDIAVLLGDLLTYDARTITTICTP